MSERSRGAGLQPHAQRGGTLRDVATYQLALCA
jgi:hypothetical protein